MANMTRRRPKWRTIRVLSFNTHVGLAIPAITWLLARTGRVHIVLVQEASRPPARKALRRTLPSSTWRTRGPGESDPLVGTFVLGRRKRFQILSGVNERISDAQPLVDGKAMYPQRNLIAALFHDKLTGWEIDASSVHTWHMKGRELDGDGPVARGHRLQVDVYAKHHALSSREVGTRAAAEGFNRSRPATDEEVRVTRRRQIRVPFRTADHPAILVTLRVKELTDEEHGRIQLCGGDWNEDPLWPSGKALVRPAMEKAGLRPAAILAATGDRGAHRDETLVGARIGGRRD